MGLSAMPKMTVADNGNNTYTVSVPTGVLPEAIETTTSDGYGGGDLNRIPCRVDRGTVRRG